MTVAHRSAAIFVAYSPVYGHASLQRFVDLVRTFDRSCLIVAVNNNPSGLDLLRLEGVVYLTGSNRMGEFSAWQEGLDHLRQHAAGASVGHVIFANDTFCVNQQMGLFEEHAFRSAIRDVGKAGSPVACGDLSTFYQTFQMAGVDLQNWICTYFFAMNRAAIDRIDWQIPETQSTLDSYVRGGTDEDRFFSEQLDPVLAQHLVAWLFGRPGKPRWYRAEALSADNAVTMKRKADAILSEKLLSARLMSAGVRITSVHERFMARAIRKLLRRM